MLISVASNRYGFGHLNRCIALSDSINRKHNAEIITFTNNLKLNKKKIKIKNPNLLSNFSRKLSKKKINKYDFLVFDISNAHVLKRKNIIKKLQDISKNYRDKIIIIDGLKDEMINNFKLVNSKILVCPYFVENKEIKKKDNKTIFLLGPKYFIPNKKINNIQIKNKNKKNIKNLLITCGGSDIEFHSLKILKILLDLKIKININLVIGPFYKSKLIKAINKISKFNSNVHIFNNPKNIWELMMKQDLVISSSGLTKYELLYLKIPSIIFCANKKQKILNSAFEKKKICLNIPNINNEKDMKLKIQNFISNYNLRKKILKKSSNIIDLNGSYRILKKIEKLNHSNL